MRYPVDPATVSQEFTDTHCGLDFAVPVGTVVRAPAAGVVVFADWANALGWPNAYYLAIDFDGPANGDQSGGILVLIDHGPGRPLSVLAHLDQTGLNPGDLVAEAELLAQTGTGNTGNSTGPHLHWELLPDGWDVHAPHYGRINPRTAVDAAQLAPAGTPHTTDWLEMASIEEVRQVIREEIARVPYVWFKNKYGADVQFESLLGQIDLNINENHKREMLELRRGKP